MNTLGERLSFWAKWLFFPGFDLHTRCRYRFLPRFFHPGQIDTLDAGCGNGALAYAAYRLGNRVLGVTTDAQQIRKAQALFSAVKVDPTRLKFEKFNLYDLPQLNRKFDQIICSETLEHIRQDRRVVQHFYDILRPGGVLHLCCPFALHPDNHLGRTNQPEDGGHVRDGYTLQSYQSLLEPVGFEIVERVGLGSSLLVRLDKFLRLLRNKAGDAAALPLFLLTWPLQPFDYLDPSTPLSLYVQAVKKPL